MFQDLRKDNREVRQLLIGMDWLEGNMAKSKKFFPDNQRIRKNCIHKNT